jgi:hypothetical protein
MARFGVPVDPNFASRPKIRPKARPKTRPTTTLHTNHLRPSFDTMARPGANQPEERPIWRWFPFADFFLGVLLIAGIALAFDFWLSR